MRLSIETNFPDVQRQMDRLRKDIADKAMARTLNATVAQAKTQMTRQITSEYTLPRAKVVERLRIERARYFAGKLTLQAALVGMNRAGRYRSINVINFKARRGKQGLTVQIKKAGGRKRIAGAFIGNKGRTVFQRTGKARLPIKPVQVIGFSQMFNSRKIHGRVLAELDAQVRAARPLVPCVLRGSGVLPGGSDVKTVTAGAAGEVPSQVKMLPMALLQPACVQLVYDGAS